jgi:heme exporter protein A
MDDTQPPSHDAPKAPAADGPDRLPETGGGLFTGHGLVCVRGGRTVFEGLDFALKPGDALVLLGPNGSGKSSLLRIMAGLLKPTDGDLLWYGYAVADDPESHHARQHYVGHLDGLKAAMTVSENLSFWTGLRMGEAPPAELIRSALGSLGLDHLADFPARMLSAGQKRRLSLARMLASPADLWLLDEPTEALDRDSIAALEQAIARHRRRGGMVVVATHSEMALGRSWPLHLDRFTPTSGLAELREDATTVLGRGGLKSARAKKRRARP